MSSLLFGVSASDPLMFATLPVLLAIISLAACFILGGVRLAFPPCRR